MRGVNPRQVKQAMRKLGIETEDLEDVQDVVIRTKSKQYVITDASVTIMTAQGQKTYQITGETEILPLSQTPTSPKARDTGPSPDTRRRHQARNVPDRGEPREGHRSLEGDRRPTGRGDHQVDFILRGIQCV